MTAAIVVSPAAAAQAYARVDRGQTDDASGDFGATLQGAVQGMIDVSHEAEAKSMQAIAGNANLTDVVTALSRADLALQSATAIRDRMVQAYQDIIKMPI